MGVVIIDQPPIIIDVGAFIKGELSKSSIDSQDRNDIDRFSLSTMSYPSLFRESPYPDGVCWSQLPD
jgi:hypothetical protein